MRLLKYINMTQAEFLYCLDDTSDVELLNKIQDLIMATQHDWKDGIPRYEKIPCGCEHVEAKKELLSALLLEYQTRTYEPEDPRTMHLCEAMVKITAEEDDQDEEGAQPEEDDAYLAPTGSLGSMTSLSIESKHIGDYESDEEAEENLVKWIIKNNVWPNIWWVSDHGNVHPYQMSDKSQKDLQEKWGG